MCIPIKDIVMVYCNRLVNLGISKQQLLYLRTKNLFQNKNLTKNKTLKKINIKLKSTGLI